ncbi:Uncharacterized membrane protein YsdA, DUF1294 family [Methanococcoides vulcani]|uniref:Uncharacterized membrane protein YsdA, DUF1294 family n=1 Tax=Methanococcoides vulcani TaxID=1353158 RepID=A0A1I0AUW1_9EURY|nr:DUF1294 domain-containing protein [Methanococcoides vulcani]SES97998.1 Uncharacterized membrane protein YsdA, DUF1294 family [Methanococcoides vulcani]
MKLYMYFLLYLFLVNAYAFWLMYSDKKKAIKNQYRIPEKTLFTWALLGGSIGSIMGMQKFRHKTRHPKFRIGMPLIFIVEGYLFLEYALQVLF